ncbi:hypothetical protein B1H15_04980, partial [Pseudomonas aeruginosa]
MQDDLVHAGGVQLAQASRDLGIAAYQHGGFAGNGAPDIRMDLVPAGGVPGASGQQLGHRR